MPTYEYKCNKCAIQFEEFQSMSAEPIKVCPECGGDVVRLISAGNGLIFKGSGFYITDYKNSQKETTKKNPEKEDNKAAA